MFRSQRLRCGRGCIQACSKILHILSADGAALRRHHDGYFAVADHLVRPGHALADQGRCHSEGECNSICSFSAGHPADLSSVLWYKLPIWAQKSLGHWTTYGGSGYQIVHQTQYNSFPYAGWLLQRDIGKRWMLGGEVFSRAAEGFATPQTQSATMVDLGGFYYFKNPGLQLLFCYGHSVVGQTENYAYLALYQTWGSKPGHGLNGFLGRHF